MDKTSSTPPTLGIRHIALKAKELERMERFYVGVLGYAVEWRPDNDNVYLTLGGADNLAIHRDASACAGGALDHFGILVRAADDVDAWAKHLEVHGIALEKKPKTHRDGARSLYVRDPEGNLIQFLHHPPIASSR